MADVLASLQAKCLALEEARDCLQSNYRFVNLPGIRLLIEWLEDNGHAGVAKEIGRHDKASQSEFATEKFNELSDEEQDEARTWILNKLEEALAEAKKEVERFVTGGAATAQRKPIGLDDVFLTDHWKDALKNPHRLLSSTGSHWEYQYDNAFKERLAEVFSKNLDSYSKGHSDKSSRALTLVCAGPGSGKSRTLT
eukprot:TRINITY_DN4277_c0_g2_i3.p2 TRINITY_DN4277_c0_g2~~TRINITY_DN4277_c0_g2_i3.p2  ORF type:complete len:216 (+),score=43.26 TRINITY_DN4277_c0_g2_i3:62-649(+)